MTTQAKPEPKPISAVLGQIFTTLADDTQKPISPTEKLWLVKPSNGTITKANIAELFVRLLAQYGYAWAKLYDHEMQEAAMKEWFETLKTLTLHDLQIGMERCRKRRDPYPPGAKEFRKLCLPTEESLGLESADMAYQHAVAGNPNEVAQRVIGEIGNYEWRMGKASDLRRQFIRRYNQLLDAIYEQF